MSVEQTRVIDAVGIDILTEEVVMTVTDHLDWTEESEHLRLLEAKLNSYVAFFEGGELAGKYPDSVGRKTRIDIYFAVEPVDRARAFLERARIQLRFAGIRLCERRVGDSEPD